MRSIQKDLKKEDQVYFGINFEGIFTSFHIRHGEKMPKIIDLKNENSEFRENKWGSIFGVNLDSRLDPKDVMIRKMLEQFLLKEKNNFLNKGLLKNLQSKFILKKEKILNENFSVVSPPGNDREKDQVEGVMVFDEVEINQRSKKEPQIKDNACCELI